MDPNRISLRGIYWKKVQPATLSAKAVATVWSSGEEEVVFDTDEIEAAFGSKPANTNNRLADGGSTGTPRGGGGNGGAIQLLDMKRATNAGIALARLGLPHGGPLTNAILTMDDTKLCLNKASSLLSILPTTEEMEVLRGYDGDAALLGSTERYFLELIAIPRLSSRLHAWVIEQRYTTQCHDLLERQQRLKQGLDEMRTSKPLHHALKLLLALGNRLNAGTARGNAVGMRIESLSSLIPTTRTTSSTSTVIGFLTRHIRKTDPSLISSLTTIVSSLGRSCRLDANEMGNEYSAIEKDLKTVRSALEDHRKANNEVAVVKEEGGGGGRVARVAAALAAMAETSPDSKAAVEEEEGTATDRFEVVMSDFLVEASRQLNELHDSSKQLEASALSTNHYYCEFEECSVNGAHTLLTRLHAFASAIVSTNEQYESERAAAEAKASRVTKAAASRTPSRASQPDQAGGDGLFEASESSLRAIIEDEEAMGDQGLGFMTPSAAAGGRQLRRRVTEGEELQDLFQRRASGLSMQNGSTNGRTTPQPPSVPQPPCSPGKRQRQE